MNTGIKKRLKWGASTLTKVEVRCQQCVGAGEAGGSGAVLGAVPRAGVGWYWPAPACRARWGTWARWPSTRRRTRATAACFPRRPGDWTAKEQGDKQSQRTALPPFPQPRSVSLFRSLLVSLRPVYCSWFQASSTGCSNSINHFSLIFASSQDRQILFSANLSYLELYKLVRFSLEPWFLSSSSCILSCTCQIQHINQGRNFQRRRLKFTWTDPLWWCIHTSHIHHSPSQEEDSVLCNILSQSTSSDQLGFFFLFVLKVF